jgi:hypothetical protein
LARHPPALPSRSGQSRERRGDVPTPRRCQRWLAQQRTLLEAIPGFAVDPPFAVGIVELSDGTRLSAQITGVNLDQINVGMPLRYAFRKMQEDGAAGTIIYGYKFVPDNEIAEDSRLIGEQFVDVAIGIGEEGGVLTPGHGCRCQHRLVYNMVWPTDFSQRIAKADKRIRANHPAAGSILAHPFLLVN